MVPSDEEILIHKIERKRKATMAQKGVENCSKDMDLEKENVGEEDQSLDNNRKEMEMGVTKGIIGNLGAILKKVVNLKQQMQVMFKDFE